MWQTEFEKLSLRDQRLFKEVANKLLAVNFLVKTKESNTSAYYFAEAHYELLKDYFSVIDWNLEINRSIGVVSLKNLEARNRINLRINESIVLLILRLLYEQNSDAIDMINHVEVKIADIHDLFAILGLESRILNRKKMNDILGVFKRFNLIEAENTQALSTEDSIFILPSIVFAIEATSISDVLSKLRDYSDNDSLENENSNEEINDNEAA